MQVLSHGDLKLSQEKQEFQMLSTMPLIMNSLELKQLLRIVLFQLMPTLSENGIKVTMMSSLIKRNKTIKMLKLLHLSKNQDMLQLNIKEMPLVELSIKKFLSNSHQVDFQLLFLLDQDSQVEPMVTFLKEKNLSFIKKSQKRKRSELLVTIYIVYFDLLEDEYHFNLNLHSI